jgi:hypothetical protein
LLDHVAIAAIVGALTLGLYASTAGFPFVFDDLNNIRDNPHIRVERLYWDTPWSATAESIRSVDFSAVKGSPATAHLEAETDRVSLTRARLPSPRHAGKLG